MPPTDSAIATSNDRINATVPAQGRQFSKRRLTPITVAALAGVILMALNLRAAVTSIPPLMDQMQQDIHFNAALIGLLGSLAPLAFAAAGLAGTILLRRLNAELIAVLLLVVTAAGQLIRPWSPVAGVFLAISAITLLAMGVGNVIMPALVKAWFPNRIGAVTAIYTTVLALGTALPALLAIPLSGASALGWRAGMGIWAVVALIAVPAWLIAGRRPRALPPPRLLENQRHTRADLAPHRIPVHRSRIAWGLGLLFVANSLNLYAMFTWLPIRLTDAGLSEATAGAQLALFAGVGVVPSLTLPGLAARVRNTFGIAVACVACFLVGYLGLLLMPARLTTLWVVIGGLGGGGFPLVLTLIGLRSATPATAGVVSAFAQTVGYCGAIAGPLVFGILHSATGGWAASFGFLMLTMVPLLIGGWITRRPATVDDELRARIRRRSGPAAVRERAELAA